MKNADARLMWRQGDVLIEAIEALPSESLRTVWSGILAAGAATGHEHRIENRSTGRLYVVAPRGSSSRTEGQSLFMEVFAEEARIVHPEHSPIILPSGVYRVWRQREYHDPKTRASIAGHEWASRPVTD